MPGDEASWAPDELGASFDPASILPGDNPQIYRYKAGYSKRTLLGGYLPVADIGVWNPDYSCGYETMLLLPEGVSAKPMERVRSIILQADAKFIWAQQLWGLSNDADAYFQNYLDKYILPNGDFLYNTQEQVEGPLNVGIFLSNSARSHDYNHNLERLQKRLPILDRMIGFVLLRYDYSKMHFAPTDRRYGLIYRSPEADLGEPSSDYPNSHPLYYQNAVWTWRGLHEHARCLHLAAQSDKTGDLSVAAVRYEALATEMCGNIQRSLEATLALRSEAMRASGISPFTPDDTHHLPVDLSICRSVDLSICRSMRIIASCRIGFLPTGAMLHSILVA